MGQLDFIRCQCLIKIFHGLIVLAPIVQCEGDVLFKSRHFFDISRCAVLVQIKVERLLVVRYRLGEFSPANLPTGTIHFKASSPA